MRFLCLRATTPISRPPRSGSAGWTASEGVAPKRNLACVDIANKGDAPETVLADVKGYEISLNRKKMLVAKGDDFYILDSDVKASALADAKALAKAQDGSFEVDV